MVTEGQTSKLSWTNTKLGFFIYGPPRTRKTMFGSTMPEPYFICAEQGLMTLADNGINVPYVTFGTYDEAIGVINEIREGKRAQKAQSLVLDDLSSITDIVSRSIIGERRDRAIKRNEWPQAVDKLRNLVMAFYDCKRTHNLLLTARSVIREDLDEQGDKEKKKLYGLPATIGQFAFMVLGIFDFALFAEPKQEWAGDLKDPQKKNSTCVLHTTPFGVYHAGCRTHPGRFPSEMPPDFKEFWKILQQPVPVIPRPAVATLC